MWVHSIRGFPLWVFPFKNFPALFGVHNFLTSLFLFFESEGLQPLSYVLPPWVDYISPRPKAPETGTYLYNLVFPLKQV